jgi:hypothetical protein
MADLFKEKFRFLLGITALFAIILFAYTARFGSVVLGWVNEAITCENGN